MIKFKCPNCGAGYKIGDEAAGRRTKCPKCGEVFKIQPVAVVKPKAEPKPKPAAPVAPPSQGIDTHGSDDLLSGLDGLDFGEPIAVEKPVELPPSQIRAAVPKEAGVKMAPKGAEVARVSYSGYFRSLGDALAFPSRPGDLVTFSILVILMILAQFLTSVKFCCLIQVAALIVYGWYWAFQFNTVLQAAGGEKELPTLAMTEGWFDDIISPLFKMIFVNIMIFLPAIVVAFMTIGTGAMTGFLDGTGAGQDAMLASSMVAIIVAFLLGAFFYPMFVLCVAIGGITTFIQPHKMIITVIRTFPVYLLVTLIFYGSCAIGLCGLFGAAFISAFVGLPEIILVVFATIIQVYVTIVGMQAIGYYYHYFKDKFAWSWG